MNSSPVASSSPNTLIPFTGPCIWCWERLRPGVAYPAHWSSTLCLPDKTLMLARRRGLEREVQS